MVLQALEAIRSSIEKLKPGVEFVEYEFFCAKEGCDATATTTWILKYLGAIRLSTEGPNFKIVNPGNNHEHTWQNHGII